ncbi:hypothetical protein ACQP2F_17945 [Actinoplanes sp. CA-030573]|uniref:hypothetical protein n=1 Tax=Actinoplanes sp. CA-030573 TaxID=3239898 RepID=UPI003D911998
MGNAAHRRRDSVRAKIRAQVRAIREGDPSMVERAVLDLSRSHRFLAPLAFIVGAFVMLFEALRLLVINWRLMLIQILPAMWIWLAMFDLKAHLLHGKSFRSWTIPALAVLIVLVAAITAASFYLNAVFAFAITRPGTPEIRPGFSDARAHVRAIMAWGLSAGLLLGVAALVTPRWGRPWFAISMSIVVGAMMLTYVTVPARLVGVAPNASRRDNLGASLVAGAFGAIVCTPGYLLGRLGILLLGSHRLFVVGTVLFVVGFTVQAGATGAVKAIKMSAKLLPAKGPRP